MNIKNFALIIGAQKCGTSSLFKYLEDHPQISTPSNKKKEQNFFSHHEHFYQGFEYYQNLWQWDHAIHKVALEASPSYTRFTHPGNLNAAANIATMAAETNTNFKFIYIMRNPIDRIESYYTHYEKIGKDEKINKITHKTYKSTEKYAIDTSKYAMQLAQFYKRFSKDNILLLNFDKFKKHPLNCLKKICLFLDINPNYEFSNIDIIYGNNQKEIYLPAWHSIKQIKVIASMYQLLTIEQKQIWRHIRDIYFTKKSTKYIRLSDREKKYILEQLKCDLIDLKLKYNFDFTSWNINIESLL
jgi:hypothetical protein